MFIVVTKDNLWVYAGLNPFDQPKWGWFKKPDGVELVMFSDEREANSVVTYCTEQGANCHAVPVTVKLPVVG